MIKNQIKRSLGEGTHIVHVVTVAETNSFQNFNNNPAEKNREWIDPTPQIGIVFGSKDGTFVHRFSLCGYEKYDDVTPEDRALYGETFKSDGRGYLITVTDDGNYRTKSDDNKDKAERIFADFLRNLGLKNELDECETEEEERAVAMEFIKSKIADRTEIQLVIKLKNGSPEYSYTKKIAEVLVPETETVAEADGL